STATPLVRPIRGEQSNSSLILDDTAILKLYRVIESGENPDVEMGRRLTELRFAHAPRIGGWGDYRPKDASSSSLAMLQAFVVNEGDVWEVARAAVDGFLDVAVQSNADAPTVDT